MSNFLSWPCHQINVHQGLKQSDKKGIIEYIYVRDLRNEIKHNKCGKQSKIAKQEIQHLALILIPATSAVPQLMENGKQGKLRKGFH